MSDEEIQAYYTQNEAQFFTDGTVTVRHILIGIDNPEPAAKAEEVNGMLDSTDFCTLVEE